MSLRASAIKSADTTCQTGARLTLQTAGRTVSVGGSAPLSKLGGEVVYTVWAGIGGAE